MNFSNGPSTCPCQFLWVCGHVFPVTLLRAECMLNEQVSECSTQDVIGNTYNIVPMPSVTGFHPPSMIVPL